MIALETPRLNLRDHVSEDLTALHAMLSDDDMTWFLPSMRKGSAEETRAYLEGCMADAVSEPRVRYNLAVVDRRQELIGSVGLHLIDGDASEGHYGLGYFIAPALWNRGYATEAVGAALEFIFENGAVRVSASALAENLSSRRVLEKSGFTQEGLLRAHTLHAGAWLDCAVYGILKRDYKGRR